MQQEQIVSYLKLQNLPTQEQTEILNKIETEIYEKILDECLTQLEDSKKEELDQLIDNSSPEVIITFLKENILDFEKIIKNISTQVIEEFKSAMNI